MKIIADVRDYNSSATIVFHTHNYHIKSHVIAMRMENIKQHLK